MVYYQSAAKLDKTIPICYTICMFTNDEMAENLRVLHERDPKLALSAAVKAYVENQRALSMLNAVVDGAIEPETTLSDEEILANLVKTL